MALLVMPQNPAGISSCHGNQDDWTHFFFQESKKLDVQFCEHGKYSCIYTIAPVPIFTNRKSFQTKKKKIIKALDPEGRKVKLGLFALNPAVCLSVFSVP